MKKIIFALTLVSVFAGCNADVPSSEPLSLGIDLDLPMPERSEPLPKEETQAERLSTKADQFDVRGNYRDIYGITSSPQGPLRAIAEFENTEAVLIAWDDSLGAFFLELIATVAQSSDVWVLTWDLAESNALRARLRADGASVERIKFFEFPHESFWTRDFGPISVVDKNGENVFIDAKYYPQRRRDDAVPTLMSRYFNVGTARPELATEGGNFMTNGQGVCVVTEWLLQENPSLSGRRIQSIQQDYFGCQQTIVLERLAREGTGHVDMFAKFLSPNTILVGQYDALDFENAAILDRNVERLESFAKQNDWDLNIVRIPMPAGGNGVYRSYTNSLIVNDTVIVPIYRGDRRYESEALSVYRNALSAGYRVVPVESEAVIQMGGAVHCTTMGFVTSQLETPTDGDLVNPDLVLPSRDGADASEYSASPNLRIPDLETVSHEIQVAEMGLTSTVRVELEIEHEYVGDLVVTLEHEGFQATLLRNVGSGQTSLSREFDISIPRGIERSGSWFLIIEDTAAQDSGVLKQWSLRFND